MNFSASQQLKIFAVCLTFVFSAEGNSQENNLATDNWLAPGHFIMMRHALAPGTGDPSNFDIDNCRTQRNLSATGRQQAREIGAYLKDSFKHAEIGSVKVFSSQWCRCKETARLLNLGEVVKLPIINSFFQNRSQGRPQTQALTTWLAEQDKQQITILVTHQVNITALTGIFPNSGEMIVFTLDENNTPRVITRLLPSKPA